MLKESVVVTYAKYPPISTDNYLDKIVISGFPPMMYQMVTGKFGTIEKFNRIHGSHLTHFTM